jgi:hypothetical protein
MEKAFALQRAQSSYKGPPPLGSGVYGLAPFWALPVCFLHAKPLHTPGSATLTSPGSVFQPSDSPNALLEA